MYINTGISAETMLTVWFLSPECLKVKLKLSKVNKDVTSCGGSIKGETRRDSQISL